MNKAEQKKFAKEFADEWKDKGNEKSDTHTFWLSLLQKVCGDANADKHLAFEVRAKNRKTTDFKDVVINRHSKNAVLIEQKSIEKALDSTIKQSDGTLLTPFDQAERYDNYSGIDDKARWIITCNFREFWIYDMTKTGIDRTKPEKILLSELPDKLGWLDILTAGAEEIDNPFKQEVEISVKAGELVGVMYDALRKRYKDPDNAESQKSLNKLCVRLVFCLYAEDAGLFDSSGSMFHDYLVQFSAQQMRRALIDLFRMLNTKVEDRDEYDDPALLAFPYVNGGLFEGDIEIPSLDDEIVNILLKEESEGFDWSKISPTIFGAVFESTLNPETRRSGGMHYTSIQNIHKVIDPLFLDDLKEELSNILALKVEKTKKDRLNQFQKKIASLKFFDPACGSGNFLTETYLSLRKLENLILKEKNKVSTGVQIEWGLSDMNSIQVSIQQFYGIEINDFACTVATTALWIAESQMVKETEEIIHMPIDFLPLKSYTNIHEGNALRKNWHEVLDPRDCSYIMGNPPFVGYGLQTKEQKSDILSVYVDEEGNPYKTAGKIDYVAGWYMKACQYMTTTNIKTALVSTNSITQGEQASSVFEPLFKRYGMQIDFAYRTFRWDSEASIKAHVHCVIIGFSVKGNPKKKTIYDGETQHKANTINQYLIDAPVVWIHNRAKPLFDALPMTTGNRPADGGHLIIEADEYDDFIKNEPQAKQYIKKLTGSEEYINAKRRYCLWLVDVPAKTISSMPKVMERINACREDRLSGAPDRQKLAKTPWLFREQKNPENYIIVPRVSSERRRYIPLGFLNEDTIPTDSAVIIR